MTALAPQNDQEPMIVAGYARVSSHIQQKGESIKTQVEQIQRCCETQGWHLEKIYRDEARSGTLRFDQRPSGRQLLTDARQGRFTLVVVADFDRLGREGEVSYVAKNLLSNLGVGLYGIAEGIAVSAPGGGLIFGIRTA